MNYDQLRRLFSKDGIISHPMTFYLLAVIIWSSEYPLSKRFLLTPLLSPHLTLTIIFMTATLCLFPFVYLERAPLDKLDSSDWLKIFLLGILGTAITNWLAFAALSKLPASTTLMMYRLKPVFVILITILFFKQSISHLIWPLLAVGIISCYFIVTGSFQPIMMGTDTEIGIGLMLSATLIWALTTFWAKSLLTKLPPLTVTWLQFSLASLFFGSLYGPELPSVLAQLNSQEMICLFFIGTGSMGLAYMFYYKGLALSSPVLGSIIELLGPVSGLIISVLLLGETFNMVQLLGIGGLLTSLYLLSRLQLMEIKRSLSQTRLNKQDPPQQYTPLLFATSHPNSISTVPWRPADNILLLPPA